MTDPYTLVGTRRTPQSEPADPRQVPNSAGGYTFTLTDDARLRRFLILGSDSATYYTSAADLTRDNAEVVLRMARDRGADVVQAVLDVSLAGRAPKQNPCLFALAAVAGVGDTQGRAAALNALPQVARTGTHLFLFARYVRLFRGWGPSLRRAIGRWYTDKPTDALAYQAVKYRQREGWSHRDLLRVSHVGAPHKRGGRYRGGATQWYGPVSPERKALFDWVTHDRLSGDAPALVHWFVEAQRDGADVSTWVRAVDGGLSWEMLPDAALAETKVWDALLDNRMPMTALVRQLPRLTRLGVARSRRADVVAALTDADRLRKSRVHPIALMTALRTYTAGRSQRGLSEWTPDRAVIDALDAAFYTSFGNVEPAGKRTLVALDVSASMGAAALRDSPLTAREVSAGMAMVTVATEPDCDVVGFTGGAYGYLGARSGLLGDELTELPISARQRLDDVIRSVSDLPFGATDCSLPMLWAERQRREYDAFIIWTDNETWAGAMHPHQALEQYRQKTGLDARLIVCATTSTGFSIANPSDPGMLDVVGFDSAVPDLINTFSRGL